MDTMEINKKAFIDQWVVVFLASWTAREYNEACAMGQYDKLSNPPIEDAFHLAEIQYKKVLEES